MTSQKDPNDRPQKDYTNPGNNPNNPNTAPTQPRTPGTKNPNDPQVDDPSAAGKWSK